MSLLQKIAVGAGGLILVYILVSQPNTSKVIETSAAGASTFTKALQGR